MKVNSQLERAQLENLTSLPTVGITGRVGILNDGKAYLDDGTTWRALLRNDGLAIIGNHATASNNVRFHRGGNGLLQVVLGNDVTAEGTLSTAPAQLSFKHANYTTGTLPTFGNPGRVAWLTDTGFLNVDTGSAWKVIVDASTVQTITGKTLVDPILSASAVLAQIATPSAPSAGQTKFYSKSNGKLYYMGPAGIEQEVGSGSGGAKNYLGGTANGNFETNTTTGWSLFNTTMTGINPTGSISAGASDITTFSTTATNPLAALYSLSVIATASLAPGQGFISDAFTIDREDRSSVLNFSFFYEVVSGSPIQAKNSTNTLAVWIYDVANSAWVQPIGVYDMDGSGKITGSFQSAFNATQYRLAVLCANALATSVSLKFDDFTLGPASVNLAGSTIASVYRFSVDHAYTAGQPLNFDQKILDYQNAVTTGSGWRYTAIESGLYEVGGFLYATAVVGLAIYKNGVNDRFFGYTLGNLGPFPAQLIELQVGDYIDVRPDINGTSSGSSSWNYINIKKVGSPSSASSGASVGASYGGTPTGTLNNSYNLTTYPTNIFDTHAAYVSGIYTVPVSGTYAISASFTILAATNTAGNVRSIQIQKNGTGIVTDLQRTVISTGNGSVTNKVNLSAYPLNAGDQISVYGWAQDGTPAYGFGLDASESSFSIARIGN